MRRATTLLVSIFSLMLLLLALPSPALAQEGSENLSITTTYPSRLVELGESVTLTLKVTARTAQIVSLEMAELPEGWTATFRGGGQIIQSVFVEGNTSPSVDLRLDPPERPAPGTYDFLVLAQSSANRSELPITLTVQEGVPGSLSFETDLPTLRGSPTTTFRYSTTLRNDGGQEVSVNLSAAAPAGFIARFQLSGQEVNSFPLGANESKSISIELQPLTDIPAGTYPFTVFADAGDLQATLDLAAEVTGQQSLSVSGPDGILSARANAGRESSLKLIVTNTGTAAAQGVQMTSSAPSGWAITLDPEVIAEIPAGGQAEVAATLKPAPKAVAGDYVVTFTARPVDGTSESAEFRITVTTSTLWGIVGLALIAVAVGVVAQAVTRFGRR